MAPRLRRDPMLASYLVFAISASAFDLLAPQAVRESVIPYTGWSLGSVYLFSLFFGVVALFKADHRMRTVMLIFPLLQLAFGVFEWLGQGARESTNPYLEISAWRPLWTVLVPALWLGVLTFSRPDTKTRRAPR